MRIGLWIGTSERVPESFYLDQNFGLGLRIMSWIEWFAIRSQSPKLNQMICEPVNNVSRTIIYTDFGVGLFFPNLFLLNNTKQLRQ